MTGKKIAAIVLAAGLGTRMKSQLPKVLHLIAGRPMLRTLLDTVEWLGFDRVVVVLGPDMEAVAEAAKPHPTVVQTERLGTGHAVAQASEALADFDGDVVVLYGDAPLITPESITRLIKARRAAPEPAVVVLGFRPENPAAYGRLLTESGNSDSGDLQAIIEYQDATPKQRSINLCNSGVMVADRAQLFELISRVGASNTKGEYYLTDVISLARSSRLPCAFVTANTDECLGINTRSELAQAEEVLQIRLRTAAMDNGVTLVNPSTVTMSQDTRLGNDVVIHPHVVFGPDVTVGDGVVIKSFCHLESATIAKTATIDPYARLRPGAVIGEAAHIGNFVEIKQATVEAGAKVNHLSYVGDAHIGAGANIGAGTIFCNYDGFSKSFTDVGAGAFIGSNSALVAPVRIGAGAVVGAGSVITKDVSADALAVARGTQMEMAGWTAVYRTKKKAEREANKE